MLWNLEIRSGHEGEKLEWENQGVKLEAKTFDIPIGRGLEFGFNAFGTGGLIERIGVSTVEESKRVLITEEAIVINGINIALINKDSRQPEDEERDFVHGIHDAEDGLIGRSLEIPEVHRQWTLTADFKSTAENLIDYSISGRGVTSHYIQ